MEATVSDRVQGISPWQEGADLPIAPSEDVARLAGQKALAIYSVLWERATVLAWSGKDPEVTISLKGLAQMLGMSNAVVAERIDRLLDNGFIALGTMHSHHRGTPSWSYRVLHPSQVEGQRAAIDIMGIIPSVRRKLRDEVS